MPIEKKMQRRMARDERHSTVGHRGSTKGGRGCAAGPRGGREAKGTDVTPNRATSSLMVGSNPDHSGAGDLLKQKWEDLVPKVLELIYGSEPNQSGKH